MVYYPRYIRILYNLYTEGVNVCYNISRSCDLPFPSSSQAKFMPLNDDRVLVTASRDGQVCCHTLTSTGELHHSCTVGKHSDSAHKVSVCRDLITKDNFRHLYDRAERRAK